MIRLLATDLDGTLLRTDQSLSSGAVAALRQCRQAGIVTVFATARSWSGVSLYLSYFSPDIFIGYGGAMTIEDGVVTRQRPLPLETAQRLLCLCRQYPQVEKVHISCKDFTLTSEKREAERSPNHYRYADLTTFPPTGCLKLSVSCQDPDVVSQIACQFPQCRLQAFSGEGFYTFSHRESTKWSALKEIAVSRGISPSEMAAFGDDQNDLEMLQNCGVGVAMGNAIPSVKEAARFSCPSNDCDGVAQWIFYYLRGESGSPCG